MLAKFILHTEDDYELRDDDLRNWDDITISVKRDDYGGLIRSCTSQFEFCNNAREILLGLYLEKRFNVEASVSISIINDRWTYEECFRCPLDFSTVEWDADTLTVSAVDNSLAALIKANKGTKYEFVVGEDIRVDGSLLLDRIPMLNTATYGFTQGVSRSESADIIVTFASDKLPWVGNIGSEITLNGTLYYHDDQTTDSDGYVLKAEKDVEVTLEYDIEWKEHLSEGNAFVGVYIRRGGEYIGVGEAFAYVGAGDTTFIDSPDSLPDPVSTDARYTIFNNSVWERTYNGNGYVWQDTGQSGDDVFLRSDTGSHVLKLKAADEVVIRTTLRNCDSARVCFAKSKLVFSWQAQGPSIAIDAVKPKTLAEAIMDRIAGDRFKVTVEFSGFDKRFINTYILAAESVRDIKDAKLYSSFSEFCDWMSAVFGYVCYIGEPLPSRYRESIMVCGDYQNTPWSYIDERFEGDVSEEYIVYISSHGKFFYHDPVTGGVFTRWRGCENFNNPVTGHPRTDTVFRILALDASRLYVFDEYDGQALYPTIYVPETDDVDDIREKLAVYFVHRSELFTSDSPVRRLTDATDIGYSVASDTIYSAVTAGYDKKDYNNINGRDEFNFSNTYSTGCNVSDKTLPLISKYRADSYGIEFAAQKRGKDTTDSESDQDVFFVHCMKTSQALLLSRGPKVENTISKDVFNAEYSPMACVRANAGFIGLQAGILNLTFASSTGNSDVVIDGTAVSSDIVLDSPFATSGVLEFTTGEVDDITGIDELIEVVDTDGTIYRGFLMEADLCYTKTEAAKYKLIVKDIVPC